MKRYRIFSLEKGRRRKKSDLYVSSGSQMSSYNQSTCIIQKWCIYRVNMYVGFYWFWLSFSTVKQSLRTENYLELLYLMLEATTRILNSKLKRVKPQREFKAIKETKHSKKWDENLRMNLIFFNFWCSYKSKKTSWDDKTLTLFNFLVDTKFCFNF